MDEINWLLPNLTQAEWFSHFLIFLINAILFIFAKPIVNLINHSSESPPKIKILRFLNVMVFLLQGLDLALARFSDQYQGYLINIGLTLLTIYTTLLIHSAATYFSRKRFGKSKELDEQVIYLDNYSTRVIDLVTLFFLVFTAIYALIKIWGADSMLETTGIFGITAAFIAFTSSIWGPDVISGLIILNSQILEDGDVVVVDGYTDEFIISKVSLIYIILYDVRNNHRTLVRNSRFIQSKIDNLSRLASTDGLRIHLTYKIGYANMENASAEERHKRLLEFKSSVDGMFNKAFESCLENKDVKINENRTFEWALTNTGDYALEYTLWAYLEKIPNTKVTATVRKYLMRTRFLINEAVYTASVAENLQLSTPQLNQVQVQQTSQASPGFTELNPETKS